MTDFARMVGPPLGGAPASRSAAFNAAGRHTRRVRLLRRAIIAGSIAGVAFLIVFAFFNPFRMALPSVSMSSVGLDGTRITMEHPKLDGFKSDGRPYTLSAKTAVQDARTPNVLELHDVDAHLTMLDKSVVHVVSSLGIYDSSKDTMTFRSDVHLTSDSGIDVRMKSAYAELKNGVVDTQEPITVVMSNGTVAADRMHVSDNGKLATFEGHVHSVMRAPAATAPPPQQAGSP